MTKYFVWLVHQFQSILNYIIGMTLYSDLKVNKKHDGEKVDISTTNSMSARAK